MCKGHSLASLLLPVGTGIAFASIIGCYFWSRALNHIDDDYKHFPFVSQMGDKVPEHYLFAVGFGLTAVMLAAGSVVRYLQFRTAIDFLDPSEAHDSCLRTGNLITLIVQMFGCVNLVLLSAMGLSQFPWPHKITAGLFFATQLSYAWLHWWLSWHLTRRVTTERIVHIDALFQPSSDAAQIWYLVFAILIPASMIAALAVWKPVGKWATAICEHFLILFSMMYYWPWLFDLKTASLHLLGLSTDKDDDL